MPAMRTTVTFDPDVAEQLKALACRRNLPFTAALNSALRAGLAAERGGGRPYQAPARPMGLRPGVDLTRALRLADELEDEENVVVSQRQSFKVETRDLGNLKPGLSLDNVAELIEQVEGSASR